MLKPVYSIYDEVVAEFGSPFVASSDAVAYRDFSSQIENARKLSNGLLATDFCDFNLVRVAFFDTELGVFMDSTERDHAELPITSHHVIANGSDFCDDEI